VLKYDDSTEEARAYAAAYALHYSGKDLAEALRMYGLVSEDHPRTAESGYALAQVQNIINEVVPPTVLLATQLKLALDYLRRKAAADGEDELRSSRAMLGSTEPGLV
jgi:hypothetical protein